MIVEVGDRIPEYTPKVKLIRDQAERFNATSTDTEVMVRL
jgi:hypothetical protein